MIKKTDILFIEEAGTIPEDVLERISRKISNDKGIVFLHNPEKTWTPVNPFKQFTESLSDLEKQMKIMLGSIKQDTRRLRKRIQKATRNHKRKK